MIAQSLAYLHDCETNATQTAYAIPAQTRGKRAISRTSNTFIIMENRLRVYRTAPSTFTAEYGISAFSGESGADSFVLNNVSDVSINSSPALAFPVDAYGLLGFQTPLAGQAAGHVMRIRRTFENGRNRIDFVIPTPLR